MSHTSPSAAYAAAAEASAAPGVEGLVVRWTRGSSASVNAHAIRALEGSGAAVCDELSPPMPS
eukprot:scaffold144323_cov27-Tisochrysis_lutea.AAC.3